MDGCLLIFRHNDVPGIIGTVGTILGSHKVNIAQMAVGRAGSQPGGDAVGILNLDSEPPGDALDEVRGDPHITSARVIHLPRPGERPAWLQG
jgi:D-3-phosphoglycerate dehydrogenase